jgi:hypothetical protein
MTVDVEIARNAKNWALAVQGSACTTSGKLNADNAKNWVGDNLLITRNWRQ